MDYSIAPVSPIDWNTIPDEIDSEVWKRLTTNFWLPEKIALSNDIPSWNTLSEDEQETFMKVLANLTVLDTLQSSEGGPTMMQYARTPHEEAVFANITFMECLGEGTELLTQDGWKVIEEVTKSDLVAQYDPDLNETSFAHPVEISEYFAEEVYEISGGNGNARQVVSGNHRVYIEEKEEKRGSAAGGNWVPKVYEARDLKDVNLNSPYRRFRSAAPVKSGEGMADLDRMYLAINADGAFSGDRYTGELAGTIPCRFSFTKGRKVERFLQLADSLGWQVRETRKTQSHGAVKERRNFYLDVPLEFVPEGRSKRLADFFDLQSKSGTWHQEFVEEAGLWDGHTLKGGGGVTFYTCDKGDSDFFVASASLAGFRSRTTVRKDDRSKNHRDSYVTNVTWNKDSVNAQSVSVKSAHPQRVWGVEVPSSFLVTRHGESPVITGNSVHARSYSSIFMTLASSERIDNVFRWAREDEHVQMKAQTIEDFYEKAQLWPDDVYGVMAKAASVLLESFLFYSGFYVAFHWSSHGKLTNSADIIRLILRDEGIHGYYIGYKYQLAMADLDPENRDIVDQEVEKLAYRLFQNEMRFTESVYDPIGWTEDVKTYVRYNLNKAMNNLGYDNIFKGHEVEVKPSILVQMTADIQDNQDFFSGSGSTYVVGQAEETTDDDWD